MAIRRNPCEETAAGTRTPEACFDLDMDGMSGKPESDPHALPASGVHGLVFSVEQPELMLVEARKREEDIARWPRVYYYLY